MRGSGVTEGVDIGRNGSRACGLGLYHRATMPETPSDRPAARRTLSVVMGVGATLLASGAATDEVEVAMRAIAEASGLGDVQAIVQFGTISVSYDPGPDEEPITLIRLARNEETDYARLAAASDLARRLVDSRMTVEEALREIDRIDAAGATYSRAVTVLATGTAAGAATILFGGGFIDVLAAAAATMAAQPLIRWLSRSGLPPFFQYVAGPAIATIIVLILVGLGLPANGPLVVVGAILLFLPGGALTAGMRDLIDGSIVSGTARVFEAILFGAAVAIGVSIGLSIAAIYGPDVTFELPVLPPSAIAVQALAAAVACAAAAIRNEVPRTHIGSIALVGALGLVVQRTSVANGADEVLAATLAAIVIGALARWLARRYRTSASIWVAAAILPLVPGRLLVEGLLNAADGGGTELVLAILVGFGIGIGSALGDVAVATLRQVNRRIVQPVVVAPVAGLVEEGLSWVSRATGSEREER